MFHLMFPAARGQGQEPVEETFLLHVGHVSREDIVQSYTVPEEGDRITADGPGL